MSVQLWTYLRDDGLGANLVGPVAAGLEEPAAAALHHPAAEPTEKKEFARAGRALALVTYKEFVVGPAVGSSASRRWRLAVMLLLGEGEEKALLTAAPRIRAQAVISANRREGAAAAAQRYWSIWFRIQGM